MSIIVAALGVFLLIGLFGLMLAAPRAIGRGLERALLKTELGRSRSLSDYLAKRRHRLPRGS